MAERRTFAWIDLLWWAFLAGLAASGRPRLQFHDYLILVAIGAFQGFERRLLELIPRRGPAYSVILKIVLASFLVYHTGGIESQYWLIYFVPVLTAAMYFEVWATIAWTLLSSSAYCSFLVWALADYELTPDGVTELAIRNLFLFLAAVVVNRFATENRRQATRYRELAEALEETNRKLQQAQEEARRSERLAALGQMSAGLAHELRNPLAVIKGSAETLMRKLAAADPLSTEMAGYISSEVNRMNVIVTRFLDFARPHKLERSRVAIPDLIDRALRAARDRWPDTPVEIERRYAPTLTEASIDGDLMEQVFTNLATNALEAMGKAGGRLRVAAAPAQFDGRQGVEIIFEDTGPGVPPELREQIFNPFFTTKETGVGLGLSIVSKIVDDHHGWIRLCGEAGKGACFRIFLPEDSAAPPPVL